MPTPTHRTTQPPRRDAGHRPGPPSTKVLPNDPDPPAVEPEPAPAPARSKKINHRDTESTEETES
jgi:hypothetical protein